MEFDDAATVNGASPYVWFGTVKLMVGTWPATVKFAVCVPDV